MTSVFFPGEQGLGLQQEDSMDEEVMEEEETSEEDFGRRRKVVIIEKTRQMKETNSKSGDELKFEDKNESRSMSKKERKRRRKEKEREKEMEKEMLLKMRSKPVVSCKSVLKHRPVIEDVEEEDLVEATSNTGKMGFCMRCLLVFTLLAVGVSFAWFWQTGAVYDIVPKWPQDFALRSDQTNMPVDSISRVERTDFPQHNQEQLVEEGIINHEPLESNQEAKPNLESVDNPENIALDPTSSWSFIESQPQQQTFPPPNLVQQPSRVERADIMPELDLVTEPLIPNLVETVVTEERSQVSPPPIESPQNSGNDAEMQTQTQSQPQSQIKDERDSIDEAIRWYHHYMDGEKLEQAREYANNLGQEEAERSQSGSMGVNAMYLPLEAECSEHSCKQTAPSEYVGEPIPVAGEAYVVGEGAFMDEHGQEGPLADANHFW